MVKDRNGLPVEPKITKDDAASRLTDIKNILEDLAIAVDDLLEDLEEV